ncbi:hypothetical protein ACFY36_25840 [Actinoplanes sp. NPDC000266]
MLRQQGWITHDITDHFENDAQDVGDPEWMEYGLSRGWSLLTQDKRIRNQVSALELLGDHAGRIFCLSSGNLLVSDRAERFHSQQSAIFQHVVAGAVGFFVVYDHGVVRRWP